MNAEEQQRLGAECRMRRKAQHRSAAGTARDLGVTTPSLSRFEHGRQMWPDARINEYLKLLADPPKIEVWHDVPGPTKDPWNMKAALRKVRRAMAKWDFTETEWRFKPRTYE